MSSAVNSVSQGSNSTLPEPQAPAADPVGEIARERFPLDVQAGPLEATVKVLNPEEARGEYEIPADEIVDGIFLGNKDNAYNQDYLKALGVTHILNVALQAECPHEKDFSCKKIALIDSDEVDILSHLDTALAFIDEARKEGKILVHCMSGMSRSAAMVAAWLIRNQRINFEQALDVLMEKRPIVDPNEGFRQQLEDFAAAELATKH